MDNLFSGTPEDWIGALSRGQRKKVNALLTSSSTEAGVSQLIEDGVYRPPLGLKFLGKKGALGKESSETIAARLIGEFDKFACGHPDYKKDRQDFKSLVDKSKALALSTLSAALAAKIGIAAGIVVSPLALLISMALKIGLRAYCKGKGDMSPKSG